MQWRIDGADPSTGADRTVIVEADNGLAAESVAHGLLVSSCRKATAKDVAEFLSPGFTDHDTSRSATPRPYSPEYGEIKSGSTALWVLSLICYAMGVAQFIFAFFLMIYAFGKGREAEGGVACIALGLGVFGWFVMGFLLNMLGSLALAVRDMARNSFHHV